MSRLSVVIPTYNRFKELKGCLEGLAAQDLPADQFEVIVCDDGSSADVARQCRSLSVPYRWKFLRQPNAGPAAARNRALRRASGRFVLFLNDDALPASDLLSSHLRAHAEQPRPGAAILGRFDLKSDSAPTPFHYLLSHTSALFDYPALSHGEAYGYDHFYTCNLSLARELLPRDPFDVRFRAAAAEDIDLGVRLQDRVRVVYRSDCRSQHDHEIAPLDFYALNHTRGIWAALFFLKHRNLAKRPQFEAGVAERWRVELNRDREAWLRCEERLARRAPIVFEQPSDLLRAAEELLPDFEFAHRFHFKRGILESPFLRELEREASKSVIKTPYDIDRGRSLRLRAQAGLEARG